MNIFQVAGLRRRTRFSPPFGAIVSQKARVCAEPTRTYAAD